MAGLVVGALAQRTRLCMVGGIRDVVLFGEWKSGERIPGYSCSCIYWKNQAIPGFWNPGFAGQPIAHTDGLWNALGMALAGFGCVSSLAGVRCVSWYWQEKEIQILQLL